MFTHIKQTDSLFVQEKHHPEVKPIIKAFSLGLNFEEKLITENMSFKLPQPSSTKHNDFCVYKINDFVQEHDYDTLVLFMMSQLPQILPKTTNWTWNLILPQLLLCATVVIGA